MSTHYITDFHLSLEDVERIIGNNETLALSEEAADRIQLCRDYLDQKLADNDRPIYGINTGFGALHNTEIGKEDLNQLQENLVKSHACGVGEKVPLPHVKLMLLLKIQSLSYGHSGVQLATVNRLIDFYNNDVIPVVYQQGSLGASGDLAPLAHLSLPLFGWGEVYYKGEIKSTEEVQKEFSWEPIALKSKEGLALLNGTQFMAAYAVMNTLKAKRFIKQADMIGSLSLDAFDGRLEPFSDLPHIVRKQRGQLVTARAIRKMLEGSEIANQAKKHVQDPYSFRCMPQVHGATRDVVEFVEGVVVNEINSVTDNPTIFPEEDEIISAGNFHGQPLALAMDHLAIALAELGSISERRVYKLVGGERGLPAFLVAKPGLNSGFMIPQYTAASVVSQNKQLCTPASVDTIDSSNGQEDHVSMGANAATKCARVVDNVEKILAIELLNAAQAIEFRRPLKTSPALEILLEKYREQVPFVKEDVQLYTLIHQSIDFVQNL
tara:strand:- start:10378 stop:11859 length:1482 start_codon:yes stop_codon:yes gene_type:complete